MLKFNPAFFWRESTSDGLYSIGNSVIVSGLNSDARYIATQGLDPTPMEDESQSYVVYRVRALLSRRVPEASHARPKSQLLDSVVGH